MIVKEYELVNPAKIPTSAEIREEGVRCELLVHRIEDWSDDVLLALYDKRGGQIRKGGSEVSHLTFWDDQAGMPKFIVAFRKLEDRAEVMRAMQRKLTWATKDVVKDYKEYRNLFLDLLLKLLGLLVLGGAAYYIVLSFTEQRTNGDSSPIINGSNNSINVRHEP